MGKASINSWSKKIVKTLKENPLLKPSHLFRILDPKEKAEGLVEDALRDLVASGAVILNNNRKLYVNDVRLAQKSLRDKMIGLINKKPNTELRKIVQTLNKGNKYPNHEVSKVLRDLIQEGKVLVDGSWKLSTTKERKNAKYY